MKIQTCCCLYSVSLFLGCSVLYLFSFIDEADFTLRQWMEPIKRLNNTLGFGDIYIINLPTRQDRKEDMQRLLNASNLYYKFVDGVTLQEDSHAFQKAKSQDPSIALSKVACYEAHSKVWRKLVASNYDSALVLEDDLDWDINLRYILEKLRMPLRMFMMSQAGEQHLASSTLKGDMNDRNLNESFGWDIIRLGTCSDRNSKYTISQKSYLAYEDDASPSEEWISYNHKQSLNELNIPLKSSAIENARDFTHRFQRYRVIKKSDYPVCMHAYAITKKGAIKLLNLTSSGLLDGANDLTVAHHTKEGKLQSYTIIPPIFSQWKTEGWSGNSDNGHGGNVGQWGAVLGSSYAWDIDISIRRHVQNLTS